MKFRVKPLGGFAKEFKASDPSVAVAKARKLAGKAEKFDLWALDPKTSNWSWRMSVTRVGGVM